MKLIGNPVRWRKFGRILTVNLIIFLIFLFGAISGFAYSKYFAREGCLKSFLETSSTTLNQEDIDQIRSALNGKNETLEGSGDFIGSINSDKFYSVNCSWANRIKEENKVWFSSVEEGVNAGREFVECNN